jgi:membrane-associated PAP2 superfamily phosphatase
VTDAGFALQDLSRPELRAVWWCHIRWPAILFVPLAAVFATTSLDVSIAGTAFYDSVHHRWIGADSWWINGLIHAGGQWLLRVLIVAALMLWVWTLQRPSRKPLRRPTAYFVVASVLSVSVTGLLKSVTNVHCPWALSVFGASQPYLHLFDPRPASMGPGHCFPAAHAGCGYALLAFYFIFLERRRAIAHAALALGICTGLLFGIAQQARGAHFLSHDLWSAFLVWLICLTTYAFVFRAALWSIPQEAGAHLHQSRMDLVSV